MPENKWNWNAYDAAMQEAGKAPENTNINIENQAMKDVAPFSNEKIIQPKVSSTPENKAINSVADIPFQNEVTGRSTDEINQRIANWKNMGVSGDKKENIDETGGYTVKGYDTLNNNKEVYVREGEYNKGVSLTPPTSEDKAMKDIAGGAGEDTTDGTTDGKTSKTGTKSIDDLINDYSQTYLDALTGDKSADIQSQIDSVFVNDPEESRFVLGEEAGIKSNLEAQLAREEAKRKTTLEASKFMLDRLDKQKETETTTQKNNAAIRRKLETEQGYTYLDKDKIDNYSESELYRDPNGDVYLKPATTKLDGTWEVKGNADDGYFMFNNKTSETKPFDPANNDEIFTVAGSNYEMNTDPNAAAWKNNNPANIKYNSTGFNKTLDKAGINYTIGTKATDGGNFLKFNSIEDGNKAQSLLLKSPSYQNLTIDAAMKRWSNSGYGIDSINKVLGTNYPSYMKMSDLTPEQLNDITLAMQINEGFFKKTNKVKQTKEEKELQKNYDADLSKAKDSLAKGGTWGENWNLIYDKYGTAIEKTIKDSGLDITVNKYIDDLLDKEKYFTQGQDKKISDIAVADKNYIYDKIGGQFLKSTYKNITGLDVKIPELNPAGLNTTAGNKAKINAYVDSQWAKAFNSAKAQYPDIPDNVLDQILGKDEWMANKIK